VTDTVRVRMYNVGFGDCFLLEFPRAGQPPFRVLVDCGAHKAGYPRPGWAPADAVRAIISDITTDTAPARLDMVVATHRHQDHVSGFAAPQWQEVAVGQVWMPWTENPRDPEATAIRDRQSRLALGLQQAFASQQFADRWAASGPDAPRALAANSISNEAAMRTLHSGFRGRPARSFLAAPGTHSPEDCPGLTVHILGPSKDPDVIRDMDPPTGQSYLRHLAASNSDAPPVGHQRRPFAGHFTIAPEDYESGGLGPVVPDAVKQTARTVMCDDDLAAAVSLDKAVNGTSLMLMFEFGSAFLLFPGDAQWGTWNAALNDQVSRDLIARTTFYKVGHHGSHNATPVAFLADALPANAMLWAAAISVHPVRAWPEIPRQKLLDELGQRTERVVRSDQTGPGPEGTDVRPEVGTDFYVPY
jgi:beta-lactamase superfamily II metal-dependent hydrolase